MKRNLALILALLMAVTLLAGCGASTAASADKYAASGDVPMAEAPMPAPEAGMMYDYGVTEEAVEMESTAYDDTAMGVSGNTAPANTSRKLIRNVELYLETREFDTAVEEINKLVAELGGYIEYSDISGRSLNFQGDYYRRNAKFVARVPAEKLNQATEALDSLCNVTSRSESVNDITDAYYDVDGRLRTLRVEEERLLALLEKAEKLEDMLTIESHLSEVRYQIERLTGQLNRYDSQVNYSTVNMYLEEVVEYTAQKAEPITFGQRIGDAFEDSLKFIGSFGEGLVVLLVGVLPFLLVYGGILLVVVLVVLKVVRTAKAKKRAKLQQPAPKTEENNR